MQIKNLWLKILLGSGCIFCTFVMINFGNMLFKVSAEESSVIQEQKNYCIEFFQKITQKITEEKNLNDNGESSETHKIGTEDGLVKNQKNQAIERFQNFIKKNFLNKHGRAINFEVNCNKAEELYLKIKDFLKRTESVEPENLQQVANDYIKNVRNKNIEVQVLPKQEFENFVASGDPNIVKLYLSDWVFKGDDVKKFNNKLEKILNLQCLEGGNFKQTLGGEILEATNCEAVANYLSKSAGPWRLYSIGEVAVSLNSFDKVDSSYLEELVAIIKHNHPEEFGFIDEIEKYVDFESVKKRCSNLKDGKDEAVAIEEYLNAPNILFNSYSKFLDDFYKNKLGYSYFNLMFNKYDEVDRKKIAKLLENESYRKEISDYEKKAGLLIESYEDYTNDIKTYFTNKNFAVLKNSNLLATMLGYSAIFNVYDSFGEIGEEIKNSGCNSNEKFGDYVLLNCDKLVVCKEFKLEERDENCNVVYAQHVENLN